MKARPRIDAPIEYGNAASFWVEYPSGLVDLSRASHLDVKGEPGIDEKLQLDIPVDGERTIRVRKDQTALVVIDMQKYV